MRQHSTSTNHQGWHGGNWFVRMLLAGGLLWCGVCSAPAQTTARPEYEVKAEFLPLFASFVTWPATAFPQADSPLVIGVLGDDPFGEALDHAIQKDGLVSNRKMVIKRSRQWQELKDCHILFISKSESDRLAQILRGMDKVCVLTVSETEGFTRAGGIINFFIQGSKVRFEINAEAARRKGIRISSQLLCLGKNVTA